MGSGASVIVSSQVIRLLIISSSLLLSFFCSAVEKRSVWLCSMQCILLSRATWLGQNKKSSFGISSAHPPPLDHHHHHDQKTPLDGDCPKNRSACVIKPRHARIPKPGDSHQHIGVFYICRPVFAIFVYFTWIVFMGPRFHYLQGVGFISLPNQTNPRCGFYFTPSACSTSPPTESPLFLRRSTCSGLIISLNIFEDLPPHTFPRVSLQCFST